MIYFVCALYAEAEPVINYYNLKRNAEYSNFQVFAKDDIMLVISGTGKIKSAVAVCYLLCRRSLKDDDVVFNLGISGSKNRNIGECVVINKIKDKETGNDYYPDILIEHDFNEGRVCTYSNVVVNQDIEDLCDMEASGFYVSASKFVSPHQIQIIKIISDKLEGKKLDKVFVEQIINKNMEKIAQYVDKISKSFKKCELINERDRNVIQTICLNLNFTENEKIQLAKKYISYKIRENESPDLKSFINVKVKMKNESKRQFTRIIKLLSA